MEEISEQTIEKMYKSFEDSPEHIRVRSIKLLSKGMREPSFFGRKSPVNQSFFQYWTKVAGNQFPQNCNAEAELPRT